MTSGLQAVRSCWTDSDGPEDAEDVDRLGVGARFRLFLWFWYDCGVYVERVLIASGAICEKCPVGPAGTLTMERWSGPLRYDVGDAEALVLCASRLQLVKKSISASSASVAVDMPDTDLPAIVMDKNATHN